MFRNEDEARTAIKRAASEAGLNPYRIRINPFVGDDGTLSPQVVVHFPDGKAFGDYEQILNVIKDSATFDELALNSRKRNLWRETHLPRFDPWKILMMPEHFPTLRFRASFSGSGQAACSPKL